MKNLAQYGIELLGLVKDSYEFDYQVDASFFEAMDSLDVKEGNLVCHLVVKRMAGESFRFSFRTSGSVLLTCDRCLDDMDYPIDSQDSLVVKLGEEFLEDDDVITVPLSEGRINVAEYIYQFIMLNIPIQHVHAPGKCNAKMIKKLSEHLAVRNMEDVAETEEMVDEEAAVQHPVDPRWSKLLKIKK